MYTVFRCAASRNNREGEKNTPAPGHRDYGTGLLWRAGFHGYNWALEESGSKACYLDYGDSRIIPQNSNHRAYGFQVRCLQE